jgi:hypothetical protein
MRWLLTGALILGGLCRSASAQIIPPPITSTFVGFEEVFGAPDALSMLPLTTEYADRGVIFSGFPIQNGGGIFAAANGLPETEGNNVMLFVSALPLLNGGLPQTPEILSFYPAITAFQFDTGTVGIDCSDPDAGLATTMVLTVQGFAPGGTLVGSVTQPVVIQGSTVKIGFASPVEKVIITSTHTCGPPSFLFHGVELFTMDRVSFTPVASAASKCAQSSIDAAGKAAKAEASCYAKALQKGLPVDTACLQKGSDNFTKGFTKATAKGGCLVPDADPGSVQGSVDAAIQSAIQIVTNGAPGPDACFAKKLTAIGKKMQALTKCFSKAAKAGVQVDDACGQKAAASFNGSLKACGTPTQLTPVESVIDTFGAALSRTLTVPTTTTTTTTTSTTTTTTPPPLGQHLSFTTVPGTSDCTINPGNSEPLPPFSGELDSDTAGTTKIADLGLGCLYIGGGSATVAPSLIPDNSTTILNSPDGTTLTASSGTSRADCSTGPLATKHCVNNPAAECSSDGDCFAPGGCQADATCYFGPPVGINGFPSSCVVNTFAQDASGTVNTGTGDSTVNIVLASRVYLTLAQPTACPICDGGFCNYGDNAGQPCTSNNLEGTSLDCMPGSGTFVATLGVNLSPLTTTTNTVTAADGLFCTGGVGGDQAHPGAFGQAATQAIKQNGSPSGDLTDGLPHASTLVSNFCIPPTGSLALDGIADLPGPGSISLAGNAQFVGSPSGAFLTE